jgi:alkanesulfonate monooxygenase SsuD/methylene tetrahydromethanopterin reductase-like flavin-dependent oxidoreductase (luciferase family)
VQADGEFFRFREVAVVPRPVTRPHPPILVACTSETTLDLAAARGPPVLIGMHIGDDEKRRLVQRWAAVAERNGHDPTAARHVSAGVVHVDDDRERAVRSLCETMPPWFERGVADYTPSTGARPRRDHRACLHPLGCVDSVVAPVAAVRCWAMRSRARVAMKIMP